MSSPRTPASSQGSGAGGRGGGGQLTPGSGRSTRSGRSMNPPEANGNANGHGNREQPLATPPSATRSNGQASAGRSQNGAGTNSTTPSRRAGQNGNNVTPQSRRSGFTGDTNTTPHREAAGRGVPPSPAMSGISSLGLGSLNSLTPNRGSRAPGSASGRSLDIDLRSPMNYGNATPRRHGGSSRNDQGTPVRHRADINSDRHLRQINVDTGNEDEPQLLIWGTSVSANDFKIKFQDFVRTFIETHADEDEMVENFITDQPFYMQKLHEIHILDDPFLNLNCVHLQQYSEDMYTQLICYPQEVIPTMDMAVNEIFVELYPEQQLEHQIQVRPFNALKTKSMRYLNPEDIDQLVTVSGMVIRSSNIMPEMREGFFKCSMCSYGAEAEIDRGKIVEPIICPHCNTNFSFTLIHNRSIFVDKQMVRLQEDLEDTPVGETPYMATLFAHGNLVNAVNPGDRITVTGIYRAAPFRLNPKMRAVRAVYKTHIDVVHFRKIDTKRLREDAEGKTLHLSEERIALIKELAQKPDIYDQLARALAPSIYEHDDVKKGILLQLFGGTKKDLTNAGRGRFRAEINILLCGDPGTSKSQLLKYIYDLVPRSQYTSGKGSSAVGLTAYITKDPETRQIVLQTGALVLADNGICCIDEFDKMNDSTRSILHEVMEQQTLSIAKAGIICQLNARTSVLAAANPVESQWNAKKNIVENVHLPHTLLSRFDLIFLMLDPNNDVYDRRLGKHMISMYFKSEEEEDPDVLEMGVLRDYIAYAKEFIHPRLSGEASHRLISAYADMRKVGSGKGSISAYPRQLESLIRLSEAHAKARLSEIVEVVDVEEACRLHASAVKQAATDPVTGIVDLSILTTGQSTMARKKRLELSTTIKRVLMKKGKQATINSQKLLAEINEDSSWKVTREMFEDALKDLQEEGIVTVGTKNIIRICQYAL